MHKFSLRIWVGIGIVSTLTIPAVASAAVADDDEDGGVSVPEEQVEPLYMTGKPLIEKGHWVFEIGRDSYMLRDGVMLERGDPKLPGPLLAGAAEQPPAQLIGDLADLQALPEKERVGVQQAWREWLVTYYGRSLSAAKRSQLLKLYNDHSARFSSYIEPYRTSIIEGREARLPLDVQERLAKETANFMIEERRLLDGNAEAQTRRYGKKLPEFTGLNDAQRKMLVDSMRLFMFGKDIPPQLPKRTKGPATTPKIPVAKSPNDPCTRPGTFVDTTVLDGPRSIYFEGRIYIAEHSAFTEIAPGLHAKHTSTIAGMWDIVQTRVRETTYACKGIGSMPTATGSTEKIDTQAKFNRWLLANGCAGEYTEDDELTLVKARTYDDTTQLVRWIKGATKDSNGKTCRARFGAYSSGIVGADWVCHNVCNSFAYKKWGFVPLPYALGAQIYGPFGSAGIVDTKAPCTCFTKAQHCCVPGSCQCNWDFGTGDQKGWNLSQGWNSTRHKMINTECVFHSVPIPKQGQDDAVRTISISATSN